MEMTNETKPRCNWYSKVFFWIVGYYKLNGFTLRDRPTQVRVGGSEDINGSLHGETPLKVHWNYTSFFNKNLVFQLNIYSLLQREIISLHSNQISRHPLVILVNCGPNPP